MTGPGTPTFYYRADHELIGKILAEKLRRRTDRERLGDGFTVLRGENGRG
jgi:hypothetical protein